LAHYGLERSNLENVRLAWAYLPTDHYLFDFGHPTCQGSAMNIPDISANQLRRAASIKDEIEKLHQELNSILVTPAPAAAAPESRKKKRTMSAAARALISAAQKKRWAAKRGTTALAVVPKKKKFTMSAAAKAAISKAAKARWAKIKAAKKK
jgi:hypothetical protein